MMDVADIQELYQYNQWANDRVFDAVSGLTPREFAKDLGNSYPSLRDTLTHMAGLNGFGFSAGKEPLHNTSSTRRSFLIAMR